MIDLYSGKLITTKADIWVSWSFCLGHFLSYNLQHRAELKKGLNSSLSFGQVALSFCLPGATSSLS